MQRRTVLQLLGASVAVAACGDVGWAAGDKVSDDELTRSDAVKLTDEQWRKLLTPIEYRILRNQGTERAFTGDLWDSKKDGVYTCAGCGLALFDSKTKFKSGTGWPSYTQPIAKDRVLDRVDASIGMVRTENVCARCGGHLGHVFPDGPRPTGLRYCINSYSMDFVPRNQVSKLKDEPVFLGGVDQAPKPKTGGNQ